jgi:acyl-CoA synthetase (NDP forming)
LQRQVYSALEALVGVTTDPTLGHVVVAGLGGVRVDVLGDAAFRLPPVTDVDAREMLDQLKARKLFHGFRGAPPADRGALESLICKVSALVDVLPEILELDLNPVKVLDDGAVVVDARIRVGRA